MNSCACNRASSDYYLVTRRFACFHSLMDWFLRERSLLNGLPVPTPLHYLVNYVGYSQSFVEKMDKMYVCMYVCKIGETTATSNEHIYDSHCIPFLSLGIRLELSVVIITE